MEFIHCQYLNEAQPQKICLLLDGETEEYYIDYWGILGQGSSTDIHFDRKLVLELPSYVYSEEEAEEILTDLEADIKKLLGSYNGIRDKDNTVRGHWDDQLIEEIKNKLTNYESKYELYDAGDWYSLEDKNKLKKEIKASGVEETIDRVIGECVASNYYVNPRELRKYFEELEEEKE